jgi:hypothetical protein
MKWMVANVVGKKYSEVDRAYLAGFVDADGAIMAYIEPHQEKKFKFRVRLELKITQKNNATLLYFYQKYNCGNVVKNRSVYDWRVRSQKDVAWLLHFLKPYSRSKQRQIEKALMIVENKIKSKTDLLRMARLADTLSRFNVRSTNRRKNYTAKIQEYFSCND